MNAVISPADIAPPAARYAHAVVSDAPARLLHTSGVVATLADGAVPATLEQQAKTIWSNLASILGAAGMATTDIVSVTTYVVAGEPLAPVMAARDQFMAGHLAASTLVTVPALARPEWRLEIAIVAAQA